MKNESNSRLSFAVHISVLERSSATSRLETDTLRVGPVQSISNGTQTRTLRPRAAQERVPMHDDSTKNDPRHRDASTVLEGLETPENLLNTLETNDKTSPFSNQTILLVDDDPDIRALARTFLEHIGFRVLSSENPDRAAQIFLASSRVDLLITDQNMPGRSGMELAKQLTTLCPELPVLMISGAALEPGMSEQFTQPGWSFLPKPFALPALLDAVHKILARVLPSARVPSPAL